MARLLVLLPLALIAATGLIGSQVTIRPPQGDLLYANPALAYSEATGGWLSVATVRTGLADPYTYALGATALDDKASPAYSTDLVGPGSTSAGLPAIAWNGSRERHLVVFTRSDGAVNQLFGLIVDANGSPAGGSTPFQISAEVLQWSLKPRVASDGLAWMVVWTSYDPDYADYGAIVRGRAIDGASTNDLPVFGTGIIDVTPVDNSNYYHVDIAWGSGPDYLVAVQWGGSYLTDPAAIGGCTLSPSGQPGEVQAYYDGNDYRLTRAPAVAANPETGGFAVAWTELDQDSFLFRVRVRLVGADGAAEGEIVKLPSSEETNVWDGVAAAWNPLAREYFLAWFESTPYDAPRRIVATRLGPDLLAIDAPIVIASTTNQSTPDRLPWNVQPTRALSVAPATADSRVLVQWLSVPLSGPRSVQAQLYDPVGLRAPRPPTAAQYRLDGTTPIPAGGETAQPGFVAKGSVESLDDATVALEVQVWETGAAFNDEIRTFTSPLGAGGRTVSVPVEFPNFAAGRTYHWRARTVNATGTASRWVGFGSSDLAEVDVRIRSSNEDPTMGELEQRRGSGGGSFAAGSRLSGEEALVFHAQTSDADGDEVRILVEVRRVGEAFSGAATATGAWSTGDSAEIAIPFPDTIPGDAYRWRAQLADRLGGSTDWVEFGGNDAEAADFEFQAWGSSNTVARCGGSASGAGTAWAVALLLLLRRRA